MAKNNPPEVATANSPLVVLIILYIAEHTLVSETISSLSFAIESAEIYPPCYPQIKYSELKGHRVKTCLPSLR